MTPAEEPGYEVVGDAADAWNSPDSGRDGRDVPVARRVRRKPDPGLTWLVRGLLVAMALAFTSVLTVAVTIDPYAEDGTPLTMATHRQLGLPECNFVTLTGKPCPACGMTTSFALLMHGDPVASARANWVGTGLAVTCLVLVPWAVASAMRARYVAIRSFERASTVGVAVLLAAMFTRWGVVLLTG